MYRWSKVWAVQTKDEKQIGDLIEVSSSNGVKTVKVTDIVTRHTKKGDKMFYLFTEDQDD